MKRIAAIVAFFSLAIAIFFTAGCGQTSVYGTEGKDTKQCGPDLLAVDYSLGLEQMIQESGAKKFHPNLTEGNFPLSRMGRTGKFCFGYRLLVVPMAVGTTVYVALSTDQIRENLLANGEQPAGIEHLLAYTKANPDAFRQFSDILAIGEKSWLDSQGVSRVPCLVPDGTTGEPAIYLCYDLVDSWGLGSSGPLLVVRQIP